MYQRNYSTGTLDKYFYSYYYKEGSSSHIAVKKQNGIKEEVDKTEQPELDFLPSTHKTVLWDFSPEVIDHHCEEDDNVSVTSIISFANDSDKTVLWQQLPKVINSGMLNNMSSTNINMQEAVFEVITTEAKYLKKLRILTNHFVKTMSKLSMDSNLIDKHDWKFLFEHVEPVKEASERFIADLDKRWQSEVTSFDISDIVLEHASKNFDVFISYCRNHSNQERCLVKLRETNPKFLDVLTRLESDPICENQTLQSFLILPVQRILRLNLLVKTILKYSEKDTEKHDTWSMVSKRIGQIAAKCEDKTKETINWEEMIMISNQLDFDHGKRYPILRSSRYLIRKGEVQSISFNIESKGSLRMATKQKNIKRIWLFLFNDLLVVAKLKSGQEDRYTVLAFCSRNMVVVTDKSEALNGFPQHAFQMFLLQCYDGAEPQSFFIICADQLDKNAWYDCLFIKEFDDSSKPICYEDWDCPQVKGLYEYSAQNPDELSIKEDDILNVYRKHTDGWFFGMRVGDNAKGWFPGNYTKEIASVHIRAKKMRQSFCKNLLGEAPIVEKKTKKPHVSNRRSHFYVSTMELSNQLD